MAEQAAGEKTEQATPRRRQEARRKGTVAKSTDVVGALTLLTAAGLAPSVTQAVGASLLSGFAAGTARTPNGVTTAQVTNHALGLLAAAAGAAAPLLLAMLIVGLVANFAQVGFVLSAEPMNPNFSKINPLTGFQRLFSKRAVFDGFKATAKMVVFAWVAWAAIQEQWTLLIGLGRLGAPQAATVVGGLAHTILLRVGIVWLVIAAVDYFFQRKEVDKQLMMTKDELKREMKEQEGSPEVKAAQYRRRRQLAKGSLASKLKSADVVVTNPTHFAVAIAYERSKMHAPMVVAKGQDYLALRIREFAKDLEVPVVENPPLARKLYKVCEVGDAVPRDLFGPVAEVLAYVYQTLKKVKR